MAYANLGTSLVCGHEHFVNQIIVLQWVRLGFVQIFLVRFDTQT